jgi:transposase
MAGMDNKLSPEEIEELKERHRACRDRRSADRIKAVILLDRGFSYEEAAKALLLDDSTVRDWESQFDEDGLEALLVDGFSGGKARLTAEQESLLSGHVEEGCFGRVADLLPWVKDELGTEYSVDGLTEALHRLGFVYKEAKKMPPAKLEEQVGFAEEYETLKACKDGNDRIWFGDAVHPSHDTKTSGVWVKKGTEKELPASSGRKRVTLNGAYCPETAEAVICEEETADSEALVRLLGRLEQWQTEGIIWLVLDNARHHRSKLVAEWLALHQRVRILYLPPYSPNLNPIERLWLLLHRKALYNQYFRTFAEFRAAVQAFFENMSERYSAELASLVNDHFELMGN